jgi:hypothetical protein
MTTMMDSLSQTVTPEVLGTIGKKIGLNEAQMQTGLDAAVPAVLGGLSNKAAETPAGLDEIMSQMSSMAGNAPNGDILGGLLGSLTGAGGSGGQAGGDVLGDLLGGLMGGAQGGAMGTASGADPLSGLLGSGVSVSAIGGTLSKSLGFDVTPILTMAVPLVIGMINKTMTEQKLDKAGVANLIETESKEYFAKGGDTAKLVQSALDAGAEAAALKTNLGADYPKARVAPLAAAKLVMEASRSGPIGTVQELSAAVDTLTTAAKDAAPASLIGVIFGDGVREDELKALAEEQSKDKLVGSIRDAMYAVHAHAPDQAASFGQLILTVSQNVAEAAKEGGFLGIGGVKVSKEEQAMLDEISKVVAS